VVERRKGAHDHLAVHAIDDAAMAGEQIAKVLDVERSLRGGRPVTIAKSVSLACAQQANQRNRYVP